MEDQIYEMIENESEGFLIDNDNVCDWAIKTIKKETEETERLIKIADSEIEDLQQKKEKLINSLESKTGYLKSKLFEYFCNVGHKETKTQESYKLLSGSLVLKKPTQKMIKNDEKLAEFLEGYAPEYIEVVKKPKWGEFKKELSIQDGKVINNQTGEVVPDDVVSLEDAPGEFDVKF